MAARERERHDPTEAVADDDGRLIAHHRREVVHLIVEGRGGSDGQRPPVPAPVEADDGEVGELAGDAQERCAAIEGAVDEHHPWRTWRSGVHGHEEVAHRGAR